MVGSCEVRTTARRRPPKRYMFTIAIEPAALRCTELLMNELNLTASRWCEHTDESLLVISVIC